VQPQQLKNSSQGEHRVFHESKILRSLHTIPAKQQPAGPQTDKYVYKTNQNEPHCNKMGNNDVLYHFNQYSSTIKVRGRVPHQYQTAWTYKIIALS
jgi:hypothetical protein